MKLTTVILLTVVLQSLAGTSYSQTTTLSISLKNAPVQTVIQQIEDQSDFYFLYSRTVIDVDRTVDIQVKNAKITEVLSALFNGADVDYKVEGRQIVLSKKQDFSVSENQQQKSVSGKVTDNSGAALPGVTVIIKGTTSGTVTDTNGNYSLSNVPENAVLQFSFVGMKTQEFLVGSKTKINVTLVDETIGIEEVVAIGYGTVKKQNLTSSITKINSEAIESRPIQTLSEAFAGQLAGVRAQNTTGIPGAELNIKIRGINTINGNSNPLYVIDGIPRDNMNDLNPNDVASIQVLKDASATSIYGARGANGVILIETKQGYGNTVISIDAFYGVQDAVKTIDVMNGPEWTAWMIYRRNETWLRQGGSMNDPMSSRPGNLRIPASWTDGSRPPVDWQDVISTLAPIQNYQISASSKNDQGSIYVSGGYMDQSGIIKETFYKRMNFRANASLNVGEKAKLGVSFAPSFSKQADQNTQGKETVIHHAIMQSPLVQINEGTNELGFPNDFAAVYTNPLERLKQMTDEMEKSKIISSIWGEYNIIHGLVFKSLFSYDYSLDIYEYFFPPLDKGITIPVGSSYVSRWTDWTIQNTLTYDFTIAKDHAINLLLGQASDEHKYYNIKAASTGFPNSLVRTLNVATTPTLAYTFKDRSGTASFFGRASYNFKDKYLLNASIRQDGSSRFGAKNKWGTFPSVSAGWKLNEEPFMKGFDWLSLLKVRASWGMAGNDRIGNYDYMALLKVDNTVWNNAVQGGLATNNIRNDDLMWESTATTDFGLDVSVFKNRVQFNFDYYINKTDNLLFNVPIPNSTGFSSFRTNLGKIENKGWEVEINTRNIVGKFNWNSSFNLSANKNKVIDMGELQQFITKSWDAYFITRVGEPVTQFYVYRTDGILLPSDFDSDGKPLVPTLPGQVPGNIKYVNQNEDNLINSKDLVPYGSNLPDLTYGFTNRFEYKGFKLSILLQGQFGGDILWLGARQLDIGSTTMNNLSRWVRSWKPDYEAIYGPGENPIPSIPGVDMSWDGKTYFPGAGNNDKNSDLRIFDATFFKIKNISLTYNFPKQILGNSLLKAVKLYVSIDNLATFDNYPGVTTESNSFGNETTQLGVDYTTYPISKRYAFGVNITF